MNKYMYVKIENSTSKNKKLKAIFYDKDKKKIRSIQFGAKGYSDYTIHKDDERKKRYINRHKKNENWNDPMTAASLSRWILWNLPTLQASINDYKKRFNLKSLI